MKEAQFRVVLLREHHGAIEGAIGIGREIRGDKDSIDTDLAPAGLHIACFRHFLNFPRISYGTEERRAKTEASMCSTTST